MPGAACTLRVGSVIAIARHPTRFVGFWKCYVFRYPARDTKCSRYLLTGAPQRLTACDRTVRDVEHDTDELSVEEQASQKIFAGNFDRIFPQVSVRGVQGRNAASDPERLN